MELLDRPLLTIYSEVAACWQAIDQEKRAAFEECIGILLRCHSRCHGFVPPSGHEGMHIFAAAFVEPYRQQALAS